MSSLKLGDALPKKIQFIEDDLINCALAIKWGAKPEYVVREIGGAFKSTIGQYLPRDTYTIQVYDSLLYPVFVEIDMEFNGTSFNGIVKITAGLVHMFWHHRTDLDTAQNVSNINEINRDPNADWDRAFMGM